MRAQSAHHAAVGGSATKARCARAASLASVRGGVLIALTAAMLTAGCGAPEPVKPAPQRVEAKPKADKGTLSAIDRMLSERQVKRMRLPGYQLVRESDEAVERMDRILRVLNMRLRTAQRHRAFGKVMCLRTDIRTLRRIRADTAAKAKAIEALLRGEGRDDRTRAENLWLAVRMQDMRARAYIHKRCADTAHVEVQVIGPDGKPHKGKVK